MAFCAIQRTISIGKYQIPVFPNNDALLLLVLWFHDESGALEQQGNKDTRWATHRLHFRTRYWLLLQTSKKGKLLLFDKEDTARYAGLLLAPAEGFVWGFFCPSGKKRACYAVMAQFWRFFVFSSNRGNI